MKYYLGVDIGTTAVKAVAFSVNGETLAKHSCTYKMYHPQPAQSEQDPYEILEAITTSVNTVMQSLSPAVPQLVGFSAAMHSILAVDENGNPLTNCMTWADNRAAAIAENLRNSDTGSLIYNTTGVPVHAMSPLAKLLWLKENEPRLFQQAYKFIGIKEFLFYKLFGEYVIDTSVASATGLLNLRTLEWDSGILTWLELSAEKLSTVVPVKQVFSFDPAQNNGHLSFPYFTGKTPFIIGGSDGALANLGSGVLNNNAMVVTIGTSAAARIITREARTDSAMRTFCYHVKDDLYIRGGASNNGAIALQWLKESLLQTTDSYEQLFQQAIHITPGCDNLLFLPYILGERAPLWNAQAKGAFFGLTINHTKAHLTRAVMEGVIYNLYSIGKVVMENNIVGAIHTTGVFIHNPLWLQLLADVFNTPVLVSAAMESSALGAVLLGMEALEEDCYFNRQTPARYEPDAIKHTKYLQHFEKMERVYELVKHEFGKESIPAQQMVL